MNLETWTEAFTVEANSRINLQKRHTFPVVPTLGTRIISVLNWGISNLDIYNNIWRILNPTFDKDYQKIRATLNSSRKNQVLDGEKAYWVQILLILLSGYKPR